MIRINDPVTGNKTLVKKIGESFSLEGQKIVVKRIHQSQLYVTIDGKLRSKPLNPFIDTSANKGEEKGALESGELGTRSNSSSGITLKGLQE
jgi:hypothetical protein